MILKLYEKNNNPQDLQRIVDLLNDGGLIIYPTDTMYAIGCHEARRNVPSNASAGSKRLTRRKTISLLFAMT